MYDIFIYDVYTKKHSLISHNNSGVIGNQPSQSPTISADGRYVTYMSYADNLVIGDTNGVADIFLYDRQSDTTRRISVDSNGNEGI